VKSGAGCVEGWVLCGCSGERGSGEVDLGKLVSGVGPFCWMMMLVSVKKKETGKKESSEGEPGRWRL
jgi:hypothetical protein